MMRRCEGTTLIDVLVGLAVGLVSVVVAYQAFVVLDTLRRNDAAVADAQASGAFALLAMEMQAGNAGAGTAAVGRWLDTCAAGVDAASTLRALDILVTDGGAPERPDSLIVRQSLATTVAMTAAFAGAAPAGSDFHIESPDGFAAGDRIVAVSRSGSCASAQVIGVGAPVAGVVAIAHTAVTTDFPAESVLVNLGPAIRPAALRYDVSSGTLRSTDVMNGDAPVPMLSNVANLKFQYGIDSDGDGALDTWSGAATSGAWSAPAVLAGSRTTLERIKALRIGIIIRGEQVERDSARDFHWVLFDCDAADKSTCPGRLEGTIVATAAGSYRYRVFETVVPLRNVIWNRGA